MKMKLFFLLALLLLPLSGCGIISIGYNYAGAYLRYSINSYASFDAEQKQIISDEVNVFMRWHRKEMLPEYVGFLQALQLKAQSDEPLTKEDVYRFRIMLRSLYVRTLQPTVEPAAKLLSGLEPVQIDELVVSLARENSKQKKKDLSGDASEQLRKRAEKSIDFLEGLVGGFSDRQLESIRQMSHQLPFATAIYLRQREDNQAALLELMRNHKSREEIADFLSLWLIRPEASRSQDEQDILHAYERASDEMIVNTYRLLTERQRKQLLKNIVKYIESFQDLARSG